MGLLSDFGLLFVLEARNRASEVMDKVEGSLGRLGETAKGTADTVRGAGDSIDESLAKTASGADALDLAAARTATAQEQLSAATERQAAAEQALLNARAAAASEEDLAAASVAVADAQARATASAAELKAAQDALAEAKKAKDADALAAANTRLAAAQENAAVTAKALTDAQWEQKALVTSDDVAAAAASLTKAEKSAKDASEGLTAAQARQAEVQKAVAASDKDAAAAAAEQAAAQEKAAEDTKAAQDMLGHATKIAGLFTLGMAAAGYETTKMAGEFQDSTTHLVTDAGESASKLQMVQAGILQVSTATGTSASAITDAMYHIESGGFHAQQGLALLRIAAEGARVGGADLDTVSKTLVGTMNAYGMSSKNAAVQQQMAASMMNQLIETVSRGDMRMQDLASSLSSVAPLAAAVGIKFSQVGGAIATMTAQGMSADQATQDLANTIRALSNPNSVAIGEMNQLGISSQDVSQHLGQRGLTGTVMMLTKAITDHMGKSGKVILSAFTQSTTAAQDLQVMLKSMPPQFRSLAQQFESGKMSATDWQKALKAQTPVNAHLLQQFAALYEKSHSFSSLLTSGGPAVQTYTAALAKMMGGATGLNTALMITGKNAGVFAANAAAIQEKAKLGSASVDNWATIQGTFAFKMAQAKTAVQNTGIAIGSALLPAVTAIVQGITRVIIPIATWTGGHRTLTLVIFGTVAAIAATITVIGAANKAYKATKGAIDTVQSALRGLGLMAKKTAADQEAAAGKAAAAQEEKAAEAATATEESAAESAAAEEEAAAESEAGWAKSAAATIAGWAKAAAQAGVQAAKTAASWAASAVSTVAGWAASAAAAAVSAAQSALSWTVAAAQSAAGWVASAATTVAAWASAAAGMVAQAAIWVASNTAKIAVIVAENVGGALATAAAWMIANAAMLLGIGLIVVAIAAAVYLIVTHWKQISEFAKKVFDDVLHIVESVINWVKSHWPLLLAILTGPIGLAVLWIVDHWRQITAAVSKAIDWVRSHWPLILAILTGPIGLAVLYVVKHFDQIKSGAAHLISDLVGFFERLPGRILAAVGDLGRLLWNAGASILKGLISGIESQVGAVENAASSVVSTIKSFFPFSPAKRGPLAGAGDPSYSGQSIARSMARGLLSGTGYVVAAAHQLAGAASLRGTAGASLAASSPSLAALPAGTGGATVVNLYVTGNTIMNTRDIDLLVDKIGKRLGTVTLPSAGRKVPYPR